MFLSDRLVEVREVGFSNIGLLPGGFYSIAGGQESLGRNTKKIMTFVDFKLEKKNIIMKWKA